MPRRTYFDFPHTCPKIDRAIGSAKDKIQCYLKAYINDLCPFIPDNTVDGLAADWAETIYNDISDCFESVRETNEEMRKEAEYQLGRLADEIEELNGQIKELV